MGSAGCSPARSWAAVSSAAGAAGRVEDDAQRACHGGQFGHQRGRSRRGQGVLPGVGVQVAAEQEGVRLGGAVGGGEIAGGPYERGGRGERLAGQPAYGVVGTEPGDEDGVEHRGQHTGQFGVVGGGPQLLPGRGAVADQQQDGTGLPQGGRGARRVPDELLPDPFAQRHLGEFALVAQPLLDVSEGEGGAGLGAADRLGEVRVAAPPVADRGAAGNGEPGDTGGGHLGRTGVCPGVRRVVR